MVYKEWYGHRIDENMGKAIPVKSQVILQQSVIEKKDSMISLVANKLIKVAPPKNSNSPRFSSTAIESLNIKVKTYRQKTDTDISNKPKT